MLVYHYQNWYIVGGGDNKSVKSCNILYFILAYDASFNKFVGGTYGLEFCVNVPQNPFV